MKMAGTLFTPYFIKQGKRQIVAGIFDTISHIMELFSMATMVALPIILQRVKW